MRYLLTGGGTGGHVYPALAMREMLARDDPDAEFLYIGVAGKAEEYILGNLEGEESIPLRFIHVRGMPRGVRIAQLWRFIRDLVRGFFESLSIIHSFDPHIIIATGGYVSAPVILAGRSLRRKIILQEQNSVPGLVTRVLSRFAHCVLVSFPETVSTFTPGKAEAAGYPVRKNIERIKRADARDKLGIPAEGQVVFVFGGSSGARVINEAIVRNLELLFAAENVIIIHGTGRDQPAGENLYTDTKNLFEELFSPPRQEERYILRDYFHDIDTVYSAADLVVSRAGAGTIMECAALGIPMVLVPKRGLPGEHQMMNALSVERAGGGIIVKEEVYQNQTVLDGEHLAGTIIDAVGDGARLLEMGRKIRTLSTPGVENRITGAVRRVLTGR